MFIAKTAMEFHNSINNKTFFNQITVIGLLQTATHS